MGKLKGRMADAARWHAMNMAGATYDEIAARERISRKTVEKYLPAYRRSNRLEGPGRGSNHRKAKPASSHKRVDRMKAAPRWHNLNMAGTSYREIARAAGVSLGTVSGALERYREMKGLRGPGKDSFRQWQGSRSSRQGPAPGARMVLDLIIARHRSAEANTALALARRLAINNRTINCALRELERGGFIAEKRSRAGVYYLPLKMPDGSAVSDWGRKDERGVIVCPPRYAEGYGFKRGALL